MSRFYSYLTGKINFNIISSYSPVQKRNYLLWNFIIHFHLNREEYLSINDETYIFTLPFFTDLPNDLGSILESKGYYTKEIELFVKEMKKIAHFYTVDDIPFSEFESPSIINYFGGGSVDEINNLIFGKILDLLNLDRSEMISKENIENGLRNGDWNTIHENIISQQNEELNAHLLENIRIGRNNNPTLIYPTILQFDYTLIYYAIIYLNSTSEGDRQTFKNIISTFMLEGDLGFNNLDVSDREWMLNKLIDNLLKVLKYVWTYSGISETGFLIDVSINKYGDNSLLVDISKFYSNVVGIMSGQTYYLSYIENMFDQSIKVKNGENEGELKLLIDFESYERFKCETLSNEECKADSDCNLSETSTYYKIYNRLNHYYTGGRNDLRTFNPLYLREKLAENAKKAMVCKSKKFENNLRKDSFHVEYSFISGMSQIKIQIFEVVFQHPIFDNYGIIFKKIYEDIIPISGEYTELVVPKGKYNQYYYFFPPFGLGSDELKKKPLQGVKALYSVFNTYYKLDWRGFNEYISSHLRTFFEEFYASSDIYLTDEFLNSLHYFSGCSRGGWCAMIAPFILKEREELYYLKYQVFALGSPNPGPGIGGLRREINYNCVNTIRSLYYFNEKVGVSNFIFDPFVVFPTYKDSTGGIIESDYTYNFYNYGSLMTDWDYFNHLRKRQPVVEIPEKFKLDLPKFTKQNMLQKLLAPGLRWWYSDIQKQTDEFKKVYCLPLDIIHPLIHNVFVYSPDVMNDWRYTYNYILNCGFYEKEESLQLLQEIQININQLEGGEDEEKREGREKEIDESFEV